MLAGGVTETITHFVGLMRLFEDPHNLRVVLNDPASVPPPRPWTPDPAHGRMPTPPLDPLPSEPSPVARVALNGPVHPTHFRAHPDHVKVLPAEPAPHTAPPDVQSIPPAVDGVSAGGGAEVVGENAAPYPGQISMQVVQVNQLQNSDQLLMVPGQNGSYLHNADAGRIFDHLIDQAETVTPQNLMLTTPSAEGAIAMVQAHDAAMTHADADPASLPFGTYVDGVLQPQGTAVDFQVPSLPAALVTSNHNGLVDPGLQAETGQNLSINSASVVDDYTQHSAMAVMGNSYSTDAIIQTNVLVDHSLINAFGSSTLPSFLTGDDSAHNAASIQHITLSTSGSVGGSLGQHVSVDNISGNFYNVSVLSQINSLADNDSVVQSSMHTYYGVSTGNNTQINDLPVDEINGNYDLIVVKGSYHAANVIYQTNALLSDSAVLSLDMRQDGTSQSISTGHNSLSNMASITHYDAAAASHFNGNLAQQIADVENGKLDPGLAALIPGNGTGTLHVLMVQGDFYDINAISQINLVSNVDTVAQYAPNPHTTMSVTGVPTTSTQGADTGGNQLANLAQIVTVGSTNSATIVNGAQYQAATLVQAGFVNDQSHIISGDPHALAPQLADLTGLPAASLAGVHDHPDVTAHASSHHDLFHGVLA